MELDKEIEEIQAEIEQLSDQLRQAEQARNSITASILEKVGVLQALRNADKR